MKRLGALDALTLAALAMAGVLLSPACRATEDTNTMSGAPVTQQQWKDLLGRRVVFGHQSVGANILNGLQALARESQVALKIAESRDFSTQANVIHFRVGENGDPFSKMKDFSTTLKGTQSVDIAAMKLCYLDFTSDSDAARIANEYIATIDRLSAEHPNVTFIAFTAPLTERQTGPKAWVKRIIGQSPAGYGENVRRTQFNERLRARFGEKGRLFDLAQLEVQGTEPYDLDGQSFQALSPAITDDGGHLNSAGERLVAAHLVAFLATVPRR
jgi:hypothetical protein